MLELGCEPALHVAGQFQGSVDESYAALRDLGCEASITKYDEHGNKLQSQAFGASKPQFNPDVRETIDIDQRMDENAKPANQCVRF